MPLTPRLKISILVNRLETKTSKVQQVGVFESKAPVRLVLSGVPLLVVNNIDIAQGVVNEAEPNIGVKMICIAIVLNKRIQEHPWIEGVIHPEAQQISGKTTFRQFHIISRVINVGGKSVIGPKS